MKKIAAIILALSMALTLCACGQKAPTGGASGSQSTPGSGSTGTPAPSGKKTVVKISMTEGMDSSTYARAVEFGKKVNADCGDAFDFQIYPSDQLGGYHDVNVEAINGTVEMIIGGLSTNLDPRGSIAYTPYLCTSLSKVDYYYGEDSYIYGLVTDIADGMGLKFLGFDISGMEGLSIRGTLPDAPLDPASDKKGLQIRTTGSPMMQALMTSLGYVPITVAWNEVYSATQSGMINGFLGANAGSAYNQFRDVIDYYLPISFAVDANRIVLSGKFWDTLTPEQQESFTVHAKEIFEESIDQTMAEQQDYFDKLEAAGVTVYEMTDEDYEALAAVARENCWPELINSFDQATYDELMAFYNK